MHNYHTHSHYCDGKGSLEEIVQAAISLNMKALGFSSHTPLPFASEWSMKAEKLPLYLAEIEKLKHQYAEQIEIYASLEGDYIKDVFCMNDLGIKMDYTLCSIHFLQGRENEKVYEIDGTSTTFATALKEGFDGNIEMLLAYYFRAFCDMVETTQPDIVGHFDKIKIHNSAHFFFDTNNQYYLQHAENALFAIKEAGCKLEVNTRGIYKKRTSETYPSLALLQIAQDFDIPIVLNSDAHRPQELMECFDIGNEVIKKAGYKEKWVLEQGKWLCI